MASDKDFRIQAILSLGRALWDMVTPDLRGVTLRTGAASISGRFLYDGAVDLEHQEIVGEVETYVVADFPADIDVEFRACTLPNPEPRDLELDEEWVFLRRELPTSPIHGSGTSSHSLEEG